MDVLVTGGGGFLGSAIIDRLCSRGERVRSLARGYYPKLAKLNVLQIQGDLADPDRVEEAVAGCDRIIHTAAKAGVWGPLNAFYQANVTGTRNILNACIKHRIDRLVYTSSPSVVFDGNDQENIDESAPYPERYLAHYPRTKAEAEQMVLRANGPDLATVALRPHLIWGPGDPHLVPRILDQGGNGKLRLIGARRNLVDSVYIDNAADAHILALDRLRPGSPIAGQCYFITNDQPIPLADLINGILRAGGIAPVQKRISPSLAFGAGALLELLHRIPGLRREPRLTRFVAKQLMTAHWFNIDAAKHDLNYQPTVTIAEGLKRLERDLEKRYDSGGK